MEDNYIIVGFNDVTKINIAKKTKEFLESVKPKGCPFNNYSMFDLLCDWIKMYYWQMERNVKIPLAEFVRKVKTDGKFIYKESLICILELEIL